MMPTYEYECEKCTCRFEVKRGFSDDAGSLRCPKCQGNVHQLISPSGIHFKGSGFYVTDIRNKRSQPPDEGKAEKVDVGKKEEGKTGKVESAGKVEGVKKEESKPARVEDSGKKERK
jgi:putative FmdB family regulatory protein